MTIAPVSPWEAAARQFEPQPRRWVTPGDMACELDPTTIQTPALRLIDQSLVDLTDGKTDRLAILVAPQEGKSERASRRFPLWLLARNPDTRIAIVSYSDEMARRWGSDIKRDLEDHPELGLTLRPDSKAAGRWQIDGRKGGVYCVGIAGSLTGKPVDCFPGETQILTEYGYAAIKDLANSGTPPRVLSYNHGTGKTEWRRIVASRAIHSRPLVEIVTRSGRVIRCTPDHRIYTVDRGYVAAADLRTGDRLVTADRGSVPVRELPHSVHEAPLVRLAAQAGDTSVLLKDLPVRRGNVDADLRGVRSGVRQTPLRGREGAAERVPAELLHEDLLPGTRLGRGGGRQTVRAVWQLAANRTAALALLLRGLLGGAPAGDLHGHGRLRAVRYPGDHAQLRTGEETPQGLSQLLRKTMRGRRASVCGPSLQAMWDPDGLERSERTVLLRQMPTRSARRATGETVEAMSPMRQGVRVQQRPAGLLRSGVRECGPFAAADRYGQLEVQGRHQLRAVVQAHAPTHHGAGWRHLPSLQSGGSDDPNRAQGQLQAEVDPAGTPHQSRSDGQPAGEPDPALSAVPHGAPQVSHDAVSVVRELRGVRDTVYDLQVDGNSNFFAGEVLAHNCLIIDDPIKDLEQARSQVYRDRAWRFWQAVAVPRLGPGAKCVLIQTRWSEDDLAGRLLEHDGDQRDGGRWRVVSIPAIAEDEDDPLGRKPGEPMVSARGDRDWAAIRKSVGEYVFASLYQQRPAPAEGGLFKRLWWRYWTPAPSTGSGDRLDLAGKVWDLRECWRFITGDLAASTRTAADFTVAAAWALTLNGDLVLLDYNRARIGEAEHYDLFRPLAQRWRVDTAFVEATQHSMTLTAEATRSGLHVTPLRADADKFSRALPYSARVSAGRVWLPAGSPKVDAWVAEHAGFPAASHDDLVDVGAYACRVAITKWAPPPPTPVVRNHRDAAFAITDPFGDSMPVTDWMSVPL